METTRVQNLYVAVAKLYMDYKLPETPNHIGCITLDDYNEISAKPEYLDTNGLAINRDEDFFIIIFHEHIQNDEHLLMVVLHEIAHVLA